MNLPNAPCRHLRGDLQAMFISKVLKGCVSPACSGWDPFTFTLGFRSYKCVVCWFPRLRLCILHASAPCFWGVCVFYLLPFSPWKLFQGRASALWYSKTGGERLWTLPAQDFLWRKLSSHCWDPKMSQPHHRSLSPQCMLPPWPAFMDCWGLSNSRFSGWLMTSEPYTHGQSQEAEQSDWHSKSAQGSIKVGFSVQLDRMISVWAKQEWRCFRGLLSL